MKEVISASELKAKCSEHLDRVEQKKKSLVVTRRGVPIARLVPFDDEPLELFGSLRGSVRFSGDVIEPIDVEWDAQK